MPTPHKHAEAIKAWAEGHQIQWKETFEDKWRDTNRPYWQVEYEYRVKPREFPKSSLTTQECVAVYSQKEHLSWTNACKAIADEAVKQYILDMEKQNGI